MLFEIQVYIEEYLDSHGIGDADGYAVKLANIYYFDRLKLSDQAFSTKIHRIKTVLFLNNRSKDRILLENSLVKRLDRIFKDKLRSTDALSPFNKGADKAPEQPPARLTINSMLIGFSKAIESVAINAFWISRKGRTLQHYPERIGQALLATYAKSEFMRGRGVVLREISSGIGFVDVGIMISTVYHLVEIKVMNAEFTGVEQLQQYMKIENRNEGSLLIFDALPQNGKKEIPPYVISANGVIKVYSVDINPQPPSQLS